MTNLQMLTRGKHRISLTDETSVPVFPTQKEATPRQTWGMGRGKCEGLPNGGSFPKASRLNGLMRHALGYCFTHAWNPKPVLSGDML